MNARASSLFAALAAVLLLTSCASRGPTPAEELRAALADGKSTAEPGAVPPEVSEALLPPINIQLPGAEDADAEPRFDVRVRGVPARDFFLGLVDGTAWNVVVPPEVSGSISLDLKNVTVPEVMEIVRQTHGFEYERAAGRFTVLPERLMTRIFHVDYIDMKRSGQSQMSAAPGEVSQAGATTMGDSGGQAIERTTASANSYSRINTDSDAQFWATLAGSLNQLVGGEGRSVTVNAQSGVVVVRAMPRELRAVADYLEATQATVQRQVILEARILEVELADGYQSGINWAALRNNAGESGVFGFGTDVTGSASAATSQSNAGGLTFTDSLTSNISRSFTVGLFAQDFTAFIDLLQNQGEVQVLSSPRVSTVNNQKAVIKVGSDEFFVTNVDSTTTTGAATTQQVNVELTPFFSGVALDVLPQIGRDGDIILHVHPSVSEVTEQVKNINAAGGNFTLPLAASTIRESDTVIRARNGQIVVLGGLMQTRQVEEETGVPFLSKLPVLGYLFKHKSFSKRKSELVILLKPTVVDSGRVWSDQIQLSSPTIRSMAQ
ncbi:MAG: pilus (MSHA type) biogenesis protein MshL [Gammaproteobacteria bacterium]|nr:pilus (MSHA type) biogenesis protein MshL [Gammaproteobacteria bacterium]